MIIRKQSVVVWLVVVSLAALASAEARSFLEVLRDMGRSISHPEKVAKPKPPSKKPARLGKGQPSPSPTPLVTASPIVAAPSPLPTATPVEILVRKASEAPSAGPVRRDLPYGVPVPNRSGFVNSPYAPRAGLVDVRGFASGTEVKDPYTGKVFLTP